MVKSLSTAANYKLAGFGKADLVSLIEISSAIFHPLCVLRRLTIIHRYWMWWKKILEIKAAFSMQSDMDFERGPTKWLGRILSDIVLNFEFIFRLSCCFLHRWFSVSNVITFGSKKEKMKAEFSQKTNIKADEINWKWKIKKR